VPWGIDQVDQVRDGLITLFGLEIKGNTSGFNSDTSFFFISSGIGESGISSRFLGNNSGFGD
jgi:hypothetical protein